MLRVGTNGANDLSLCSRFFVTRCDASRRQFCKRGRDALRQQITPPFRGSSREETTKSTRIYYPILMDAFHLGLDIACDAAYGRA